MRSDAKTTTAEALLGMLSLGAMSGYELRKLIEESIGNFWSESFGQIYPTLKRLEAEGFVSSTEGERAGSKVYSLTDAGFARLGDWLGVMPRRQIPRNELLLKLFFGDLLPVETVLAQVEERRQQLAADLVRYDGIERELKRAHPGKPGLPFWLMTVRYGQAEARALLGWCDETLAELEERHTPGAKARIRGEGLGAKPEGLAYLEAVPKEPEAKEGLAYLEAVPKEPEAKEGLAYLEAVPKEPEAKGRTWRPYLKSPRRKGVPGGHTYRAGGEGERAYG